MQFYLLFILVITSTFSLTQTFDKSDLIGTWRACGDVNWDEEADTLFFQKPTPACRDFNCGEHDWSFRESGSVEFIFTSGCDTGFNSKSKIPKRWLLQANSNRLIFITNNGDKEFFDIQELGDNLILIHRKDLED